MRVVTYLVAAALMLCSAAALAQISEAKGMGEVKYDSWHLKDEQKAQALRNAKINAVERYVAQGGVSVGRNFSLVRDQVASSVNEYVLGYNVVSERHDEDAKRKQQRIAHERRSWQVRWLRPSGKPDKNRRPGRPWRPRSAGRRRPWRPWPWPAAATRGPPPSGRRSRAASRARTAGARWRRRLGTTRAHARSRPDHGALASRNPRSGPRRSAARSPWRRRSGAARRVRVRLRARRRSLG